MRIAFVLQAGPPNERSRAIWQRLDAVSREHQAVLFTEGPVPESLDRLTALRPVGLRAPKRGAFANLTGAGAFATGVLRSLARLRAAGWAPDAIYTFHTSDLLVGAASRALGFRWVVDILDPPELLLEDVPAARRGRRVLKVTLLKAFVAIAHLLVRHANLVVVSAWDRQSGFARLLREDYGVPRGKMLAVPNGIDAKLLERPPTGRQGPARARTGALRLIYVGALSPERGTSFLLEVVAAASLEVQLELTLVGLASPAVSERLRQGAARLAPGSAVRRRGALPHRDTLEEILEADVGLYPFPASAPLEGVIPVKVGEYLALGKPVLASDLVGVRPLVRHGQSGYLLEPSGLNAWAAAIVRLANQPALRAAMGAAARASAAGFAWPAINRRLLERLGVELSGAGPRSAEARPSGGSARQTPGEPPRGPGELP